MNPWFAVLALPLSISIAFNILQFFKIRIVQKTPQPTLEAQKLLHEITGGSAILRISVIEPGDILIRSPRG